MKDGGPMFPSPDIISSMPEGTGFRTIRTPQPGITVRQWYAGMAMQGIVSNKDLCLAITQEVGDEYMGAGVAKAAYEFADAMLAEREKGEAK